ncbi:ion transporter, partial [Aphanothece microscopica]|uniref:ion transporter n=1 Tax=Aphanothece microscopica TaxID=1049561 RepID=UPI0039852111
METIEKIVHDLRFQRFIIGVILVNAIVLGLMTLDLSPGTMQLLNIVDDACLVIFVLEIALKLIALRGAFFKEGWNIFDFIVVAIALFPESGGLGVLRTLRVLRLMRLISVIPSMRRVITGMFVAIPGG